MTDNLQLQLDPSEVVIDGLPENWRLVASIDGDGALWMTEQNWSMRDAGSWYATRSTYHLRREALLRLAAMLGARVLWDPDGGRPVSPDPAESATHGATREVEQDDWPNCFRPYHDANDLARIAELESEIEQLRTLVAALQFATEHRAALTASLRQLIARIRRIGGHSTPEEQDQLWEAERLVAP